MLLACLDREGLAEVASGWRCDLHDKLGYVRAARPALGGTACDMEVIAGVRSMSGLMLVDNPALQGQAQEQQGAAQ